MRITDESRAQLAVKFAVLFPHLDERQRRLLMAAEARGLGHGGIRTVARAAAGSETTVRRGVVELEAGEDPLGRVRRQIGGRKPVADIDPGLRPALLALVEPDARGDPMSPLRWTVKSTRTGWVNVGTDHDTAAFAVESIRRWWHGQGRDSYPQATRLLMTADAGGSNGYRTRAWKLELAHLAAETRLTITVCHLPPGHLAEGNLAEALDHFERYAWRLRNELGLRPTQRLRQLVAGLRQSPPGGGQ